MLCKFADLLRLLFCLRLQPTLSLILKLTSQVFNYFISVSTPDDMVLMF